jgi:hypothetical protein
VISAVLYIGQRFFRQAHLAFPARAGPVAGGFERDAAKPRRFEDSAARININRIMPYK